MSSGLPLAVNGLAQTVAMPSVGPNWASSIAEHMAAVRDEMRAHVRATEGPTGAYARVLRDAPRLAPGIQALVDDQRAILAALESAPATTLVDVERLRAWVRDIVDDVRSYRQRGANLLYEAYMTDLGEPG